MTTSRPLPIKLKKEPLIDAVFEIRFSSSIAASSILPGFFFAKLQPIDWQVESLPIAEIPSQMRNNDPNLRYQPVTRIHWDNFIILVGDIVLGIGCKMPYAGWNQFRERIVKIIEILVETKIVSSIERYSLKYVDLIQGDGSTEQIKKINMDLKVGSYVVNNETFAVRVEIQNKDLINLISIAAPAIANLPDGPHHGTLVDIDTVCNHLQPDVDKFLTELPELLDAIHIESKKIFFDCLRNETIDDLEPIYE